jgi:hypothetical protein
MRKDKPTSSDNACPIPLGDFEAGVSFGGGGYDAENLLRVEYGHVEYGHAAMRAACDGSAVVPC